jgi:hypothetical protein
MITEPAPVVERVARMVETGKARSVAMYVKAASAQGRKALGNTDGIRATFVPGNPYPTADGLR